jgi:amidase
MEPQSDGIGAFVPGDRAIVAPTGHGPLDGIQFAVKDLFDVAGFVTSGGNPDWARTHGPATGTAPVVAALLAAGAEMVGKTRTVELAYGLTGENPWHGTPRNPRVPARLPGGSSCGSAAAVAGGLVPLALGSDTGGSVRIPASYCGLYGIRPSQGAIGLAGTIPLAPSLDTPGWFTRSAELLERVGQVLLPGEWRDRCSA